mmetsp:Transcript_25199/g.40700  ORF Transcript_25199/g.40700 Transcript_25199/m.40700 type:complete len:234 (-) Transcript_25199:169-870(-)
MRNLRIGIPKLNSKKRGNKPAMTYDGEIDAAILDVSKEPWQVLKLYEFKLRPADIPKAEKQRREVFRKLFKLGGSLVVRDEIKNRKVFLPHNACFDSWFPKGIVDSDNVRVASYKHFVIVTQPFNTKWMTGLPSWAESLAFKMCVTEDETIIEAYSERLQAMWKERACDGPEAIGRILKAHKAEGNLVVVGYSSSSRSTEDDIKKAAGDREGSPDGEEAMEGKNNNTGNVSRD